MASTAVARASELTVSIPFIGGKLEAMIAELFAKALNTEGVVGRTWLATPD